MYALINASLIENSVFKNYNIKKILPKFKSLKLSVVEEQVVSDALLR